MSKNNFQKSEERTIYQAIGRRIRAERESLGFTQDDLAREVEMLRTSITNIEAGRQRLPIYVLYRIARALGVSVEYLLSGREKVSA